MQEKEEKKKEKKMQEKEEKKKEAKEEKEEKKKEEKEKKEEKGEEESGGPSWQARPTAASLLMADALATLLTATGLRTPGHRPEHRLTRSCVSDQKPSSCPLSSGLGGSGVVRGGRLLVGRIAAPVGRES